MYFQGSCLGEKLSPFSAASQNSTLEKWTFHKIQYEKTDSSQNSKWGKQTLYKIQYNKNWLFTKFNSVQVLRFSKGAHPILFLEITNAPCIFLDIKN